jgi:alpha-tubulin suppressor-like RCC1 family protein
MDSRVRASVHKVLRALAVFGAAATLASALLGMLISLSPIETQAAGSTGSPGSAWAWGSNSFGQLGNGIITGLSTTPVAVSLPSGTTVKAIAGGAQHSLALASTGQVLAWGRNVEGELGDGTTIFASGTPVVVSLPSGITVTAIAGGGDHSLALTTSGQVWAWGSNSNGQLGNGTLTNSNTPVAVSLPLGTTVTAIAGGGSHSLALTDSGQVLAWGDSFYGQLGNSTVTYSTTPIQVNLPSGTTVTAIAGGGRHSLALTDSGQMLAWGDNFYGQLGNGFSGGDTSTPNQVSLPSGTTVTAIAAGGSHSLARTSSGQVLGWGSNSDGQLGNGTGTDSSTPVAVSLPAGTSVTTIAAGGGHSLALTSRGQMLAWGYNLSGALGNGTTIGSSTPIVVSAAPAVVAIAGGGSHSLAIQLPAVAVLPAMTNGAYGGYITAATIQNTGSASAPVRIAYFDQNGAPVGTGDLISSLPVNASWTVRQDNGNSFPSTGGDAAQAGSAVVYSSQPLASFVNEFAPGNVGDATSYSGVQVPSGVGATLYAPTIVNNAYGGYTTGIGLLNQGSSPTDVTITYRDGGGAVINTQTVSGLAGHAYHALYSGDAGLALPSGFAGTATITSSAGQPLGAVVNETGPGGQFSSYDALASGSSLLNAPVALNNAFGGYYTGMGIQNISATAGTVSVTYYDASGVATAKSFSIPAFGSLGVYQGSATDGPAAGAYTAVIQSSTVRLVAIVNEVAPGGAGSAGQSTSYNTFSTRSSSLHLPLVEFNGGDPWNTGEGIMNTGTSSTTVTVTYYDSSTGAFIGNQFQTLGANAFWGLYQPTSGLPSGSRTTAVITTSSGGQVAVICNESSATTFMSYNGQ